MIQLKKFENQQQSLSGASPLEFTVLSERSLLDLSTNKLTGPMSKAIRTHRTLNSSSKGIYQSWSSRFSSLYPVSLHPLLGTPPSPDGEAHRRRRLAPSEEADEWWSVPWRQRGWTRGARSEAYQTKAWVARSRPKRSEEAAPAGWGSVRA